MVFMMMISYRIRKGENDKLSTFLMSVAERTELEHWRSTVLYAWPVVLTLIKFMVLILPEAFEVHHTKSITEFEGRLVNPETDLIPLCSNCHSMAHRERNNVLTLDQIKKLLSQKNR